MIVNQLDWLKNSSIDFNKTSLMDLKTAWLVDNQLDWLKTSLINWKTAWLILNQLDWLKNSLINWKTAWLIEKQLDWLKTSLIDWKTAWLIENSLIPVVSQSSQIKIWCKSVKELLNYDRTTNNSHIHKLVCFKPLWQKQSQGIIIVLNIL